MQNGRLASLMARKAQIEAQVEQERDHLRLSSLKRLKLHVKEEIARLSA